MDTFAETSKLIIKQKFEPLEALANAAANALDLDMLGGLGETANHYDVYTDDGGDKFRVIETSEYCGCCNGRAICRPNHKLQLRVFEPSKSNSTEAMVFDRPCKCGQCCAILDICRQEMTVFEGPEINGNVIGYIKQPILGGLLSPTLDLMDREESEEAYATIKANAVCCIGGVCCDHSFEVTDKNGTVVGKIVKTKPSSLGEFAKEMASDADAFALELNQEASLTAQQKANIFAGLYLIDYMFFENEGELKLDAVNQECSVKCCDMYCCGCVCPCSCNCGGNDDDEDGGGGDE
mmetsp:Transcript_46208/g.111999  ORF Transcript_46208/g.111999 Transcript_46208/m.111999 type:complete len:294 (-) Transcript_46208:125-1006(-)|eukprot:CAMPEP_0113623778 /NCGR_PEP_ID=MMETSP0017_2-20120614/12242_1 /TAXON_ID=2856 /ORGANISM="Cylindrotheca closterium" /LENGTH=293 /DNA_ID=CAMNT_0000533757 /DNA_START=75 /DNA_END=956 /DNA_ORIENTATION=+ /assembly_acc=CAM_ASM_000147